MDYFPSTRQLLFRKTTIVHQVFLGRLIRRITEQLRLLASACESSSRPAGEFAKDIENLGCSAIAPLNREYGFDSPDQSFRHFMSPSSTVVVEVAHSEHQNWRVSRLLAEEYILGSNLEVRVVVGVNLEYEKTKRAVFSVWRAKQREDEVWVVETVVRNRVRLHWFYDFWATRLTL